MANTDYLNELFGSITGDKKYDSRGYHCVECSYELDQISAKTLGEGKKKLFWCTRKSCSRYGFVTVVAKVKNKQ